MREGGLRRFHIAGERPLRRTSRQLEARLGKLVKMPKRGRADRPAGRAPETAEIVLFTGVRYERNGAPLLPNKPTGAASRKRRRG